MTTKAIFNTKDISKLTGKSMNDICKEFRKNNYFDAYKIETWQSNDNWEMSLDEVLQYIMPFTPACKIEIGEVVRNDKGELVVDVNIPKHLERLKTDTNYKKYFEDYIYNVLNNNLYAEWDRKFLAFYGTESRKYLNTL